VSDERTYAGKVEMCNAVAGSRWSLGVDLWNPDTHGVDHYQVSVLTYDSRAVTFDGERVASAGELARRIIDAKGVVTATLHDNVDSYVRITRAEFVTAPYPETP